MNTGAVLTKIGNVLAVIFLKLIPLAFLFLAYLRFVHWAEETYSLGKLASPYISALVLGWIPLALVVAFFYRSLKRLWGRAQSNVVGLGNVLVLFGILSAAVVIQINHFFKASNEMIAIRTLERLYERQSKFHAIHKKYASLQELSEMQLIQPNLIQEGTKGYRYSVTDISATTFTLHADRVKDGMGNSDFLITESGEIRFIQIRTKGTLQRGQGELLDAPTK